MMKSQPMRNFSDRVYSLLKTVPVGRVTTYKAIAQALGTKAYRAVGQALRKNPYLPLVPCHRVVNSDGRIGGYFGKKSGPSLEKKITLLRKERVEIVAYKVKDFAEVFFGFETTDKI
ncbi:MAG: MGMT family protein [Patescibacteria group bacterium]